MMCFRRMLFAATLVYCAALGASQPVSCVDDGQCGVGYFCETSVYVCHECLSCKDLKRESPWSPNSCIKSVGECGPCLKGLVEDRLRDINCVSPSNVIDIPFEEPSNGNTTIWVAAGIAIALLFVIAVAVAVRYVCKHSFIKFNMDTNIGATLPTNVMATAPESPPPYTLDNPTNPPRTDEGTEEDTSYPLIKPYQPPFPAFESQDHQNVSVYNPPAYVRLNNSPRPEEDNNDLNGNYYPPTTHEENTTPSAWVPGPTYTDAIAVPATNSASKVSVPQRNSDGNASDFLTALAIARNTDLIQPPPVTIRMQALSGSDEASSSDDAHTASAHSASARASRNGPGSFSIMNVNQIINLL